MNPIYIVIGTQLLFTTSDILARINMPKHGFTTEAFVSPWFVLYFVLRMVAMFGQLYVFTTVELGKTMALFGATSIVLANVIGFLLLQEVLSPGAYIGVTLAVFAFLLLAIF